MYFYVDSIGEDLKQNQLSDFNETATNISNSVDIHFSLSQDSLKNFAERYKASNMVAVREFIKDNLRYTKFESIYFYENGKYYDVNGNIGALKEYANLNNEFNYSKIYNENNESYIDIAYKIDSRLIVGKLKCSTVSEILTKYEESVGYNSYVMLEDNAVGSLKDSIDVTNIAILKDNVSNSKFNDIDTLTLKGTEYYYIKQKINVNNSYVISLFEAANFNNNEVQMKLSIVGSFIISIIVIIITLYMTLKEKKDNDKKLIKKASYDEVTGLYSFYKFNEKVIETLSSSSKGSFMLAFFDINNFKLINETYGYEEGNMLLRFIGESASELVGKNGIVTRYNDDDFIIFTKFEGNKLDIIRTLSLIEARIEEYKIFKKMAINCILSTGVSEINLDEFDKEESIDKFIERARLAHSEVQGKHDKRVSFFDGDMQKRIYLERDIEAEMEEALINNDFKVYYQPKYSFEKEEIKGAEALVRWNSKLVGKISPTVFIPVFERNGFILQLDEYIFRTVCSDIREMLDNGIEPVRISVNLSRKQIFNIELTNMIKRYMTQYHIDPKYLEIEITETMAINSMDELVSISKEIKDLGLAISIDDFGSGYSSLEILEKINFDVIKLDKTFIDNIIESEKSRKIVHYTIALAKSLKATVLAEGVETKVQARYLSKLGCDLIQGFYYSKVISKEEFVEKLEKSKTK